MCANEKQMDELHKWIEANRTSLRDVFVQAALQIDMISEMLTDVDRADRDYVRQKLDGIITSSHAVLREYMQNGVRSKFRNQPQAILDGLVRNAPAMVEENMQDFINALIDFIVGH